MAHAHDRRELLLNLAKSDAAPPIVPAAFFMHFDSAHHAGRAAIDKHREFFEFTGMDLVKVQLELPWPKFTVSDPGDWTNLPVLDEAFFVPQLDVVSGLVKELGKTALVVVTLYSPFMVAGEMGGSELLNAHLDAHPEPVQQGLRRAEASLLTFVRACVAAGVDGFYHSTQGAEAGRLKVPERFAQVIVPSDLQVMREIDATCRFNILHICDYHRGAYGGYPSHEPFLGYPGHLISGAPDFGGIEWPLPELVTAFRRPFMGGLDRLGTLANGNVDDVRAEVRRVLASAPGRFMLAANCTVPAATPWENLRAAIEEAHAFRS